MEIPYYFQSLFSKMKKQKPVITQPCCVMITYTTTIQPLNNNKHALIKLNLQFKSTLTQIKIKFLIKPNLPYQNSNQH